MNCVLVITAEEEARLANGESLNRRNHLYVPKEQAYGLVRGLKSRPWGTETENYHSYARWAVINGKEDRKYIIVNQDYEWRKVTQRGYAGAGGFATMQLVPQATSRQ